MNDPPPGKAGSGPARFGKLLRQLRDGAGLTQQELAEASGVAWRTIVNLEHGHVRRPRDSTLKELADAFQLTGSDREAFLTAARGRDLGAQTSVADLLDQTDGTGTDGTQHPEHAGSRPPRPAPQPRWLADGKVYQWTETDVTAGLRIGDEAETDPLDPWETVDVIMLRQGRLPNLQREFSALADFVDTWLAPADSRRRHGNELARMLWIEGEQGPERSKGLLACLAVAGRSGRAVCDAGNDLAAAAQACSQLIGADDYPLPPVIAVDLGERVRPEPWNDVRNAVSNALRRVVNADGEAHGPDPYPRFVVAGTPAQKQAAYAILAGRVDIEPVDVLGRAGQRPYSDQLPESKSPARERFYNRGLPVTAAVLYGRRHEMTELREAWASPHTRVMSIVGYGGMGKSALVNAWLHEMQQQDFPGANGVFAWSFYSQGTKETLVSADPFVTTALEWLSGDSARSLNAAQRGRRLAELIKKSSFLLVLDGMEPLQHPLGAPHVGGHFTDESIHTLLTELARPDWDGLCLVTTRVPMTALSPSGQAADSSKAPSFVELNLENLSEWDGADLLQHLIGRDALYAECRQAVREVDGHALAVTLLGHYLMDVHGGDLSGRFGLSRLTVDAREGGHARRIMASYADWLEQDARYAELAILLLIGLFDRPAHPRALQALLSDPRMAPFTGMFRPGGAVWDNAIGGLRAMGLVHQEVSDLPGTLDAHPLVREHFRDQIQRGHAGLWLQGNRTLYDFYRNAAVPQPDTPSGMGLLYASVTHGCAAGMHQEVFDELLLPRVWRDRRTNYSTRRLGMTGSDLVALSNYFYPRQWTELRISSLSAQAKTLILTNAGVRLRQLGRVAEARSSFAAVVREIDSRTTADAQELEDASYAAAQNCELLVIAGKLIAGADETDTALFNARRAVQYADRGSDPYFRIHARSTLAEVFFMINDLTAARSMFDELRTLEDSYNPRPQPPFLYSQGLFRYGYYMIETGQSEALLEMASSDPEFGKYVGEDGDKSSLLSEAIRLLVLGAARRALIETGIDADHRKKAALVSEAESFLKDATQAFQIAGYADYMVRGLLEYAHFYRIEHSEQNYAAVLATLDKAGAEAKRGQMDLLYTDVLLQRAACYLASWPTSNLARVETGSQIVHLLTAAAEQVASMGYARRVAMLQQLQATAGEFGLL
jgi:transcriptional regulator with XRE-family HTH domain